MISFLATSPHLAYVTCPRTAWELPTSNYDKLPEGTGIYNFALSLEGVAITNIKRKLQFNHNDFTPIALSVNYHKGRRLGSVLDREKIRWIIFDLGPIAGEENEEPEDEDGGDTEEDEGMGDHWI